MDVDFEEILLNKSSNHRDRGPAFSEKEVKALMALVVKYKSIILNKHTDSNTNHAKEKVWAKIANLFNKQKLKLYRSPDTLKTKWENLKRECRRVQKNLIDESDMPLDEINNQVLCLLYEAENLSEKLDAETIHQELNDSDAENNDDCKHWNGDKTSPSQSDSDDDPYKRLRALNFTPQESNLLLKLVRDEKRHIFMEGTTKKIIHLKRLAWERVTQRFNESNTQKRSLQVLRRKLFNMKQRNELLRKTKTSRNRSTEQDGEASVITHVKEEANIDLNADLEFGEDSEDSRPSERAISPTHNNEDSMDPLQFVLNADSGIVKGFTGNTHTLSEMGDQKDIVKMKIELLNYKLETAKLERKRLEDAMKADKEERDVRAIENSLRLRAARLEVITAESKLPDDSLALAYTEQESLALQYMKQPSINNNT